MHLSHAENKADAIIAWLSLFSHDVTVDAQAEAYDEAVVQLMDMGFKYEQVKDALKVAGNDVATATQLLLVDSTQYAWRILLWPIYSR